jgi:ubiquinone/menaquinone biosynthesis C-methylase UbiE
MSTQGHAPSPSLIFQTFNAYQRTAVLKAAIELDLFTAVGEGKTIVPDLAKRCGTSERGTRILCDYLTIIGFLVKSGKHYSLTQDSAVFLDRRSPAYMGDSTDFLLSPSVTEGFKDVAAMVRKGGTVLPEEGSVAPEHPMWVKFARAMEGMQIMPAKAIAELVQADSGRKLKVLDIAAGHGLFGLAFGRLHPQAEIVGLDWPNVLEVAKANAAKAGLADRYRTIAGSAFDVDYGDGYDIVLLTNFLHHFDAPTCEALLKKVYRALSRGGRAVTLELVPNDDRVSPPEAASFSMMMLASTPAGDAYTFSELEAMFKNAGFSRSELFPLPPTFFNVIVSYK